MTPTKTGSYQTDQLAFSPLTAPAPPHDPIPGFRVLYIMGSSQRQANLLQRSQGLRKKLRMIYTTTRDRIDFSHPDSILKPIWTNCRLSITPDNRIAGETHSILD